MYKLILTLVLMVCSLVACNPVHAKYVPNQVVNMDYNEININIKLPASHDIMDNVYTDLECLALNVYFESRGESQLGQELVAQVTMNRVRFSKDKSICDIVRQKSQFSWTADGKSDLPQDIHAYVRSLLVAIKFIKGDYVTDVPFAEELTNFHSYKSTPQSWRSSLTLVAVEGGHRFYVPTHKLPKSFTFENDYEPNGQKVAINTIGRT